jgi:hypothetical protein
MLDHDAHYGGTHYALALVAEHDGERAKAREHLQQAQKYWAKADSDLAELVDLKSKLGTETAWR